MSTPWLTLFERKIEELMLPEEQALLGGSCPDYASYKMHCAALEAYGRALEIARGLDDDLRKGIGGASYHPPQDH